MTTLLEEFADSVSGVAAFVGGSATGAGLGSILEWPRDCDGSSTDQTCTNIIGMTLDKESAAVLVAATAVILGGLASMLRSIGEAQAKRREARENAHRT
jgi:hypothetical protein